MSNQLTKIKNFLAITDNLGTAGQPTSEQFDTIRDAGYELVINIAMPATDNAVPNEAEHVTSRGMSYVHIPVEWKAPRQQDLDFFFQLMKASHNKKIFVHCAANMRVSAFIYLYRIICEGEDPTVARETLNRLWEPHGVWKEFVETALTRHGFPVT